MHNFQLLPLETHARCAGFSKVYNKARKNSGGVNRQGGGIRLLAAVGDEAGEARQASSIRDGTKVYKTGPDTQTIHPESVYNLNSI